MSRRIQADRAVLTGVTEEFRTLGGELQDAVGPVTSHAQQVAAGAGQFADALADGVAAFHLSWAQALEVTGRMSGNIAANVGHLQVDLDALDVASSS